jgi:ParB family chromosome partitioning protein
VTHFVKDAKAAGFHNHGGSLAKSGPMTDEQKAERRTLVANNKAWTSAEVVRREWLTTLLRRKTLPKEVTVIIARGLTVHRRAISAATQDGNLLAHDLLGIERTEYFETDKLATLIAQIPTKAQHVALAIMLGACESVTSRQTWRTPSPTDAAYFTQLAAWGYTLSDVEQIVVANQHTNDTENTDQSGKNHE